MSSFLFPRMLQEHWLGGGRWGSYRPETGSPGHRNLSRRKQDHREHVSAALAPRGCVTPGRSSEGILPTSSAPKCSEVSLSSFLSSRMTLRGLQALKATLSPALLHTVALGHSAQV